MQRKVQKEKTRKEQTLQPRKLQKRSHKKGFPQGRSTHFNPFEKQYPNGEFRPSQNFGTSRLGGTNFLTQTLIRKTNFEIAAYKTSTALGNNPQQLQQMIKVYFPLLRPYIKDEIEKMDWKKNFSPLQFFNDCLVAFEKKYKNFRIDLYIPQDSIHLPELFVLYDYPELNSYSIQFCDMLMLKDKKPEYYDIVINLFRLLRKKIPLFGDLDEMDTVTYHLEDYLLNADDEEHEKWIREHMELYKNGEFQTALHEIRTSNIPLSALEDMIKHFPRKDVFDRHFHNMCMAALEIINAQYRLYDFVYTGSNEFENCPPVYPHELASIHWSCDDDDPVWKYNEDNCEAKWNEGGQLNFRYVQNIKLCRKLNFEIPEYPKQVKNFINLMNDFQNKYTRKQYYNERKQERLLAQDSTDSV